MFMSSRRSNPLRAIVCYRLMFSDSKDGLGKKIGSLLDKTKGTIFELMARNMSDKDVKKFMNHWGTRIDDTPISSTGSKEQVKTTIPVASPRATATSAASSSSSSSSNSMFDAAFIENLSKKKDAELYHPLLGELLIDVGYKRVYLTSVNSLARTPVWKRQRILRPERSAIIADEKIRRGLQTSVAGVISLYQDVTTKEIGIIDGQHRAGALMVLCQRGYWNEHSHNVLIEVFPAADEHDVAKLFREINAAEPVRMIDLPEELMEEERLLQIQLEDADDTEIDESNKQKESVDVVSVTSSPCAMPAITTATDTTVTTATTVTVVAEEEGMADKQKATVEVSVAEAEAVAKKPRSRKVSSSNNNNTADTTVNAANAEAQETSKKANSTAAAVTATTVDVREIITEAVTHFRDLYPEMFKPTARCKVPHLNIDVLRDELYNSPLFITQHGTKKVKPLITNASELIALLEMKNIALAKKYTTLLSQPEELDLYNKSFKTAILKAQQNKFFLGMEKQWLESF